ncbi:Uncharacterised protein [Mycobacteroides abscessus subsp. abscessus]|uniref:VG15 protein n=1 Tax=Mycobacteroides abscessus TaxID=36809 RepID=UPI00092B29F2|nr:hypothetical protein [Mycobacteroides abscessus]SHS98161.1 Uncharacterised protein [Mycobacteroides abscessus subsp. abscessus]SLK64925.1 Uncharacterised protein [Mycobacteroides abscessus subsp. abscessus]
MTPAEYAKRLAGITSPAVLYIVKVAKIFARYELDWAQWIQLLHLIYPEIENRRYQAADIAREFYDSQREVHRPDLDRDDQFLVNYSFERFVEGMEPARKRISQMDSRDNAISHMALRAAREIENAGRRQIIRAAEAQTQPQVIQGWARVATGRETCAWCLMLISRGPVYSAAERAGLDLDDELAARMVAAGQDVSEYMDEWHTGCDCKVVPVFDVENWVGKKEADLALDLWNDATREADELIESGESRTSHRNTEAINALRRRIERGEIDPFKYAALAA